MFWSLIYRSIIIVRLIYIILMTQQGMEDQRKIFEQIDDFVSFGLNGRKALWRSGVKVALTF